MLFPDSMLGIPGVVGIGRAHRRCQHWIDRGNHYRDYATDQVPFHHGRIPVKLGAMLYMSGKIHNLLSIFE